MKPIIAVPATLALIYRAYSKKSLTPAGIVAATVTAIAHAVHPWNLPFVLLAVFFLAGTRVTHVRLRPRDCWLEKGVSSPAAVEISSRGDIDISIVGSNRRNREHWVALVTCLFTHS